MFLIVQAEQAPYLMRTDKNFQAPYEAKKVVIKTTFALCGAFFAPNWLRKDIKIF